MRVEFPCRIVSEANRRDHWGKKAKRVKAQREFARLHLRVAAPYAPIYQAYTVTLTRIAPAKIRDGDNLQSALKAIRDGAADYLGIDDSSPRIVWLYGQERGDRAVRIEIKKRTATCPTCGRAAESET